MTIETASYINQLNTAYPRSTDLLKEGDDHIRMIKNTLKATFPRIDKAVNITADTLNSLSTNIVGTGTGIRVNGDFTIASGKAVNFGGNRLQGAGRPTDANGFNTMDHSEVITFGHMRSLFRMLYPKNSVFCTGHNEINPANLPMFAGTTWVKWGNGTYVGASGNGNGGWQWGTGTTGSVSFGIPYNAMPRHSHGIGETGIHGSIWTDAQGNHNHRMGIKLDQSHNGIYGNAGEGGGGDNHMSFGGGRNEVPLTSTDGNHSHNVGFSLATNSFRTDDQGGGDQIGYQPRVSVMWFWIRTDDNGVSV